MKDHNLTMTIVPVAGFLAVAVSPCLAQGNIVQACYQKTHGDLRIVSNPDECEPSEMPITLNGEMPEGPLPGFEGELCWNFTKIEDEDGPSEEESGLISFGSTYMNGPFYSLQGLVDAENEEVVMGGTAVVLEDEVQLSLQMSQDHTALIPWRDVCVMHVSLDKATLDGTWWGNCLFFGTDSREMGTGYSAGTMTLTSCP